MEKEKKVPKVTIFLGEEYCEKAARLAVKYTIGLDEPTTDMEATKMAIDKDLAE